MELTEKDLLDKTHYGLNIYAFILRSYYQGDNVISLSGRLCKPTKNPFKNDSLTLILEEINQQFLFRGTTDQAFNGNPFDFAALHFNVSGQELLQLLNDKMHLNIGITPWHKENDFKVEVIKEEPKPKLILPKFSYFKAPVKNTVPVKEVTILDVYHLIKNEFQEQTKRLRTITDKKEARAYKAENFDYVTFSGVFTKRSDKALVRHSGLLAIDFDHVADISKLIEKLLKDEYFDTEILFTSPSGDGLKWIISIDITEHSHKDWFTSTKHYIEKTYQLEVDNAGKDVSRACFLPHDLNIYLPPEISSLMEKKKFNVQEWLSSPEPSKKKEPTIRPTQTTFTNDKYSEVVQLIEQIELNRVDLTTSYEEWRNIGFALADEFGEYGRELYRRVSQFHSDYSRLECDKQFDNCMKANGSGVNISTLFYLAKNAGLVISISKPAEASSKSANTKKKIEKEPQYAETKKLPTLPESIFSKLPDFLKRIVEVAETNEERDLLLLGSLATMSCAFPKVYGIYHNKKVFANLFLFVSAAASAGKGRLNHCRKLVKPIHDSLKALSKAARRQYEVDLAEYHVNKKKQPDIEKPIEPPIQLLFIPANSSASGAFQLLNDNQGKGLIFETEGDTLANTFKSVFGNYSDGFRKSFHHETINYYRKTDREYVDLESPCLSTVLSGTPRQVLNLIPSAEDGLFSRFMFYYMNMQPVWSNVFASNTPTRLDDYFYELGIEFFSFYEALKASPNIQFLLTEDQQDAFNQFFATCFQRYFNLKGEEYIGTIRRLGLITFRMAMILSALRLMDSGEIPGKLICEEQDFKTALSIAETLFKHASFIFNQLPDTEQIKKKLNKRERFYEMLPQQFNRQGYLDIASQLGIKDKTAQGYITNFVKGGLLHRDEKDSYTKPNKEIQDTKEIEEGKT